jgi:V8-like Glu-specific endopeptidase
MLHLPSAPFRAAFAFALILATIAAAPPALADELQDAIEAVKQASDAELLAELQRRQDTRTDGSVTGEKITSRDIKTGLGQYDDTVLNRAVAAAKAGGRAIYGPDNRMDWHEIEDAAVKRLASATVALFNASQIEPASSDRAKLKTVTLGEHMGLCKGETFADQATGAFCSGTLVEEDVVLTAGHCVREISGTAGIPYITSISFVFGYRVERQGETGQTEIPQTQIFRGRQVLGGELVGNAGRDWALVKLDRPVPSSLAEPVTAWHAGEIQLDQSVYVIGHPSGLPVKYAPDASVQAASDSAYFTADLDTFGGNSGSGVFDAATHELVGVLVRGDTDYYRDEAEGCVRAYECPTPGCKGEDVTRIGVVAQRWQGR